MALLHSATRRHMNIKGNLSLEYVQTAFTVSLQKMRDLFAPVCIVAMEAEFVLTYRLYAMVLDSVLVGMMKGYVISSARIIVLVKDIV